MKAQDSYGEDRTPAAPDFESLVQRHYGPLYRFALSLTHTESDACDLVQETFHVWAVKGHQLQEASKAKAWLFTTLHRLFLQSQRHLTRFPHLELNDAADELPPVEPALVDRLDSTALVGLLARLDPMFQAPVALFYLEDYSYAEIADILGVPLGTVKSRIARGLAQLKRLLAHQAGRAAGSESAPKATTSTTTPPTRARGELGETDPRWRSRLRAWIVLAWRSPVCRAARRTIARLVLIVSRTRHRYAQLIRGRSGIPDGRPSVPEVFA